jgi:hypothetical protein
MATVRHPLAHANEIGKSVKEFPDFNQRQGRIIL